jgi:hypothetical protein
MNDHVRVGALVVGLAAVSGLGAVGTGCGRAETQQATSRALLGRDTFLYLLCNATAFSPDSRTRFVESSPGSGSFSLTYDVNQDWLVADPDGCQIVETDAQDGWGTHQTRYAFRTGASLLAVPDARPLTVSDSSYFQIKYPSKGTFTASVNWHNGTFMVAAAVPAAPAVQPQRSLTERNAAALAGFTMRETLDRIASNGGVAGGAVWHDALFKTLARSFQFPDESGPFCDSADVGGTSFINGFAVECSSNGAPLVGHIDHWRGLAATNRFDLAPAGGEDCGEARLTFFMPPDAPAIPSSPPGRSFSIFEAVIPNPRPETGLEGCRALEAFWAGLSSIDDPAARGAKLVQAYYTGEPSLQAAGFKPFMTFENFGAGKGRVRTEVFGGNRALWDFREFRLDAGGGATAMPVAQSLPEAMFEDPDPVNGAHPKAALCQGELLDSLATLLGPSIDSLGVNLAPDCFNSESSNEQDRFEEDIINPSQKAFADALVSRAQALAPQASLTATQIAARAEFSGTCIGCHQRFDKTASRDLGQALTLPVVTLGEGDERDAVDFTQINNLRTEPCAASGPDAAQTCFKLSPVLASLFLPHRQDVLEGFLASPAGTFHAPSTPSTVTVGGAPRSRLN